ncbi:MAG TPA: hypothetical protein VJU14_13180 [Solirubrobacterales bacterium]|nr:hypothetical protein [Solirubrobacterales bacterium]
MSWLSDVFGRLWAGLLGRERLLRSHDDLYGYASAAGTELGNLEQQIDELPGDPPVVEVADGLVKARVANLGQKIAKRLKRLDGKAARYAGKAELHENAAIETREQLPDVEPMTHAVIDFFTSRVWIYLTGFVLVVLVLEAAGMDTSLISYETVLGDLRIPMSLAAGAILVGAGHGAGHLIHSALEARGRTRTAYLAAAGGVLLIGVVTVISLGAGRDANTKAADDFASVGVLRTEALRLDSRAEDLLQPLPEPRGGEPLPEPSPQDRRQAEGLQAEAVEKREAATRLDAEARDERTLGFFAAVQVLGLAVGAIGGFFFAAAAPTREHRRLTKRARRSERRAVRYRGRETAVKAKAEDVEAAFGRLVEEENGWRLVSLGHHEQRRVMARGKSAGQSSRSPLDLNDMILRNLDTPNRNGSNGPAPVAGAGEKE